MSGVDFAGFVALVAGSLIGATLRWLAQIVLNPMQPLLPPGTLAVNVVGGFVIGGVLAVFDAHPTIPSYWRVFAITGILGGLTTFSSFTAESMRLLQEGRIGWALAHAGSHVFGALVACFLAYAIVQKLT